MQRHPPRVIDSTRCCMHVGQSIRGGRPDGPVAVLQPPACKLVLQLDCLVEYVLPKYLNTVGHFTYSIHL
jgi:hypothetical protein